jgi:CheY-like chemotaxis protein
MLSYGYPYAFHSWSGSKKAHTQPTTRPDAKTIPIIAMTANAFTEDVRHCIQARDQAHRHSNPISNIRHLFAQRQSRKEINTTPGNNPDQPKNA